RVKLVDEQDEGPVECSPWPVEDAEPSFPVPWRAKIEREAVPKHSRHGPEEHLFGVVVAEEPLHGQGTRGEAVAVARADLLDRAAHEPGFPRLAGRPEGEEVPGFPELADQLGHALLDQLAPLGHVVEPLVDRSVRCEVAHWREATTAVPRLRVSLGVVRRWP